MTLRKSRALASLLAAFALGAVALGAACSGQGEGERCSVLADNGGNEDCAGALLCVASGQLNGSSSDRCCPADRTQATTAVCAVQSAVGIDAGLPPEGGTAEGGDLEAGAADARPDVAADARPDVAADAPTDAPADGG